jgi:hypothetical protein
MLLSLYCAKITPFALATKRATKAVPIAAPGGARAASTGAKHTAILPLTLAAATSSALQLHARGTFSIPDE